MDEKGKDESSSDSDSWKRDGASSPYAKRRPYSIELRRNRVVRQESNRSSGSSILATSVELRKNRVSQPESNRSSVSSLIASLQSYTSIIFSRQSSRNVTETHF